MTPMTPMAQILKFPGPYDREGRPSGARRSPFRSPVASRRRWPMSHKATDWAWEQPVRGVRQHVLLALAERANGKTWQCTPSLPELATRTGLGESTIRGHLRAMEKAGLIAVEWSNGGRRKRSLFTLLSSDTPQELRGNETGSTPQELDRSEPETPQELPTNPAGAGPVVLRTNTRTREPGTTSAAAASADEQAELFPADPVPPPVKAGRSVVVAERKELAQANAGDAVAAWCDAFSASHDAKPTSRQIGQVGREARQLLEAGNPPERVMVAAKAAGECGFPTVERQYRDLASRRPGPAGPARPSTTDQRTAAAQSLKARFPKGGAA